MQKKVPRYRQKVQIFKSTDGTGTKKVPRHNCTRQCPPLFVSSILGNIIVLKIGIHDARFIAKTDLQQISSVLI